jgi:ribosome recycling factor
MNDLAKESKLMMTKRVESFEKDLLKLRTGRANISVLDGVKVNYYGNPTPIAQVGSLSTPDAKTILISPYEKALIQEIEKAIMKADLGLQPTSDGNVVRIPIPPLTEERRKEIVKTLKKFAEEAKVGIRQVRRDANDKVKKQEKDKVLTEDDSKKIQADIQKNTDALIKQIDDRVIVKEKEIMTI